MRLAANVENTDVVNAPDVLQDVHGLPGQGLELVQVRPENFQGIVALDSGQCLHHVVPDILRKIPGNAGNLLLELGVHTIDDFVLGSRPHGPEQPASPTGPLDGSRPVCFRAERHEIFRALKAFRVGAVVGPAGLRGDRLHLRIGRHDGSRVLGDFDVPLQGLIQRSDGANPQIALLQFRHEFVSQKREQAGGAQNEDSETDHGRRPESQTDPKHPKVGRFQEPN